MTFFEKDFSILDASSYAEKSGSSLPAKSQEHLQLVQNKQERLMKRKRMRLR